MGLDARLDDPEEAGEFLFKMEQPPPVGILRVEVVESTVEEIGEILERRARLGDLVDPFHEVGGGEGLEIAAAQTEARTEHAEILQGVQVPLARRMDFQFAQEKKIELAGEGALGTSRALGDRFDDAVLARAPVHDQARLRERIPPDQGAE